MNKLYYQKDNGAIYINLDGGLRHIPNPNTFLNLYKEGIAPSEMIQFENAASAPITILSDWPLMDNAKLVKNESSDKVYMTDIYPWESTGSQSLKYRHIVNPTQFSSFGFSWSKVVVEDTPVVASNEGVPMDVNNGNYSIIFHLTGYHAIYGRLFFGTPLNPIFYALALPFMSIPKQVAKTRLKALIVEFQGKYDALMRAEGVTVGS